MRWPEHYWLLSSQGELVRGRCRATNLCDYCAVQTARENARMLSIDAEEHFEQRPQLVAIVGTRTATDDPAPFYRGREKVVKALRRRWPQTEYVCQAEFTTGKGRLSGGQRRPHWNLVLKGIDPRHLDEAREIVRRVWCSHVDAEPQAQYVEALANAGAFMEYIASHFQKESQAPPKGWRGQRFNCSRGYFTERTRAEARQAAKESLRQDRELWKATQRGLSGDEALTAADAAIELAGETEWRLYGSMATIAPQGGDPTPGPANVSERLLQAALEYVRSEYEDDVVEIVEEKRSSITPPLSGRTLRPAGEHADLLSDGRLACPLPGGKYATVGGGPTPSTENLRMDLYPV